VLVAPHATGYLNTCPVGARLIRRDTPSAWGKPFALWRAFPRPPELAFCCAIVGTSTPESQRVSRGPSPHPHRSPGHLSALVTGIAAPHQSKECATAWALLA
jgi:hypothetical protein